MRRILVIATVLLATLGACSSGTDQALVSQVDPGEALALLNGEPNLVVLDVRTPEEVAAGALPNAVNIDYYSPAFREQVAALDRSQPVLVYCRSGNRSAGAVEILADLGFSQIYELKGGILNWINAATG